MTGAPCFSCGEPLPDRYALLIDGRGACPECVEAKQLADQVHAWKNRALEEPR